MSKPWLKEPRWPVTDYLADLVRSDAPRRLKAQNEIELTNQQFDHFIQVCDNCCGQSAS